MFFEKLAAQKESTAAAVLTLILLTVACGTTANTSSHGRTPSYTLKASPSNLSVNQGGSRTSTIKVTDQNGFNGSVDLSVSGLPAGVTASFNPSSTSSSSTLSLTANASAPAGSVTVTVTGTSNGVIKTVGITLDVSVPPPPGSMPASFFALNQVDPTDERDLAVDISDLA